LGSKSKTTAYSEVDNDIVDIASIKFAVPPNQATKKDIGKTRMDLLPPKALEGIAKIMTYGAAKYNDYNYKQGKGLDWDRMLGACYRHLNAWNDGEDLDPESGQSHLYHAGCCIMMLIDLIDSKKGQDTRYRK